MKGLGWPSYGAGIVSRVSCVGSLYHLLPPSSNLCVNVRVLSRRFGFGSLQRFRCPSAGWEPKASRWVGSWDTTNGRRNFSNCAQRNISASLFSFFFCPAGRNGYNGYGGQPLGGESSTVCHVLSLTWLVYRYFLTYLWPNSKIALTIFGQIVISALFSKYLQMIWFAWFGMILSNCG